MPQGTQSALKVKALLLGLPLALPETGTDGNSAGFRRPQVYRHPNVTPGNGAAVRLSHMDRQAGSPMSVSRADATAKFRKIRPPGQAGATSLLTRQPRRWNMRSGTFA